MLKITKEDYDISGMQEAIKGCPELLRKLQELLIHAGKEELDTVQSFLLVFVFDYLCEDGRLFEHVENKGLVSAIATQGSTAHRNSLVAVAENKLTRVDTLNEGVLILEGFPDFAELDITAVQALLKKNRKLEGSEDRVKALLGKMKPRKAKK